MSRSRTLRRWQPCLAEVRIARKEKPHEIRAFFEQVTREVRLGGIEPSARSLVPSIARVIDDPRPRRLHLGAPFEHLLCPGVPRVLALLVER